MFRLITLVLLLSVSPFASAQIYKCFIDGVTSFQDTPCPPSAQADEPYNPSGGTFSTYSAPDRATSRRSLRPIQAQGSNDSTESHESTTERRNREASSRAQGVLTPGMSRSKATITFGRPDRTSTFERNGQDCERLTWYDPRFHPPGTYRATVCDGEITRYFGP